MDSITQASLGAAVGHLCWNKEIGAKALVAGALIGTIPDLDILAYPVLDQVQRLYWHRGESHSIFFVLLGGLATGLLVQRYCFGKRLNLQKAFLGALFIYATHSHIPASISVGMHPQSVSQSVSSALPLIARRDHTKL